MKRILGLVILLSLTACATQQVSGDKVAVDYKYIVKMPPKELLTIPPKVSKINTETATQADVAKFLVEMDKRQKLLESNILGIVEFLKKEDK
jgi:hypothetical protein